MRVLPRQRRVVAAAALGSLVTLAVPLVGPLRFVYERPSVNVAMDTVEGMIAAVVAYLFFGRFQLLRRQRDLALAIAFTTFVLLNLVLSAFPTAASGTARPTAAWGGLMLRIVAAGLLLAATVSGEEEARTQWLLRRAAIAFGAAAAAALLAVTIIGRPIDEILTPAESAVPHLVGHPLFLASHLVAMALLLTAAWRFDRRAGEEDDHLLPWLGAFAVLLGLARLNYFLFPSLYPRFVHVGDFLRLTGYLVLLVAAAGEINRYWQSVARSAAVEERRRLARDLHDGLAQELAFIKAHTSHPGGVALRPEEMEMVAEAADRALIESRRAIRALNAPGHGALEQHVVEAARLGAADTDASVTVALAAGLAVPHGAEEDIVWIVREAVAVAARHRRAATVRVGVEDAPQGVRITIEDDGGRAPQGRDEHTGPGIVDSIRRRDEGLGGIVRVTAAADAGTTLDVVIR